MGWNPDNHNPGEEKDTDEREVPSGDYVMGIFYWKRISPRAIRLGLRVLAGPMKGAAASPTLSTNVEEKKGSADRMYHFCKAFHIGGELNFDAECFNRSFLGQAGKVKIEKSQRGKYTNYDVKKAFHRTQTSEREREVMMEFQEAWESSPQSDSGRSWNPDDPGPSADDFPADDWNDDIPF